MTTFTFAKMTEAELLDACRKMDRLAQKELYDRYATAMYTAAYRITADFELANDVLQEGFLKVFQKLHTFRAESTVGAWIKVIIVRTALAKIKKEPLTEPISASLSEERIDWSTSNLDIDYLEKAIQRLPPGYRSVFLLIEVEGYSHQEVANMLGISTGTSKSQLFFAKKKLREYLSHEL